MAIKGLKKCVCILMAAFLLALSIPQPSITVQASGDIPADYSMVAESDGYELYLFEPTMSIILKNKATGSLLLSTLSEEDDNGANNKTWTAYMQSGIVLSAIKNANDTYQVDLVSCKNTIDYSYQSNGFAAKIYWQEYDFGLTVNVSLEGDALVVEVPEDSIVENGKDIYIGTVSLFPLLGYSYLDNKEGYMFIPDGNGALIYLDDKDGRYASGYSQMIYGADAGFTESTTETLLWNRYQTVNSSEKVLAPVFGMAHTDDQLGYLAIVEGGEKRASIEAQPNGVMVDYNRCYAKFLLRRTYIQPLNNSNSGTMTSVEADRTHGNLKLRYILLSGEDAGYSGMAVAYRSYLLDNGLVQHQDIGYRTRVDFLGTEREEFLISTRAVVMTDTDQIREIFSELQAGGVDTVLSIYKGWQKGGMYQLPVSKYKADGKIGGTASLTDLISDWAEAGYDVYLYNDALQANPAESNTTFNIVKKVNKRRLEIKTRAYVYDTFNYLLPTRSDNNLDKFIKSYTSKGVNNLAVAGISNNLFSYSYNSNYYDRVYTADIYQNSLADISKQTSLILEKPFAYLWSYTGAMIDMPLGTSDFMYEDEEVPFFSIVLKGIIPMYSEYVNFEANKQEFKLQMIESGVYPSFYITHEDSADLIYTNSADLYSTQYTTYRDTIMEYDADFRRVAALTGDAMIASHEKLAEGVSRVTYDNGVVIYVNYNQDAVTVDGVTVDGLSYKAGE
ncbi:MAG: DUF5696 domain-containing protein [bacterium]|nr:DUF5696 domain-containing protein [bacterium]MCM1374763.1 DUF5696 domain-containing protein [Muribaculum sp.]